MTNQEITSSDFASKPHPQQLYLFSYLRCKYEQIKFRTFELFTIKSVKKFFTPSTKRPRHKKVDQN